MEYKVQFELSRKNFLQREYAMFTTIFAHKLNGASNVMNIQSLHFRGERREGLFFGVLIRLSKNPAPAEVHDDSNALMQHFDST